MLHSSLSLASLIILTALISLGTLADLTALVCCRGGAVRSQGGISAGPGCLEALCVLSPVSRFMTCVIWCGERQCVQAPHDCA